MARIAQSITWTRRVKTEAGKFPEWMALWERLLINTIVTNEAMLFMFRTMSARQRYEWINREYPGLGATTPKRKFASWIGMAALTVY